MANLYTTKTDGIDIVYAADVNELQAGVGFAHMPGGRLTLETGVPVSVTDQSAKTTLYYTPYYHNRIPLYSGSAWQLVNFTSDLSVTLVGTTASLPYDVFCYNNSGTATLELTAWTNTTTRATALTRQDGRYVKTGDTTRLYIGTICINGTGGQTDDTISKRFLWNMYNRVIRPIYTVNSNASWTNTATSSREYNNGSGQTRGEFVIGERVWIRAINYAGAMTSAGGSAFGYISAAINSTTAILPAGAASICGLIGIGASGTIASSFHKHFLLSIGYSYLTQVENSTASATQTVTGTNAGCSIMVEM